MEYSEKKNVDLDTLTNDLYDLLCGKYIPDIENKQKCYISLQKGMKVMNNNLMDFNHLFEVKKAEDILSDLKYIIDASQKKCISGC